MWTHFWDMHSGGGQKEDFAHCYIEAPEEEAKVIFYNLFGHNPERVSCTCCGEDYSVSEVESLEQVTAYQRGCAYAYFVNGQRVKLRRRFERVEGATGRWVEEPDKGRKYVPLDEYLSSEEARVIRADEIKPEHRIGTLPKQGYIWHD